MAENRNMAENIYRFEFVDNTETAEGVGAGIEDAFGVGAGEKPEKKKKKEKKTFSQNFTKKVNDTTINQVLLSPLNTITGGLASPVYRTIKSIKTSANVGAMLGSATATIGIMAIQIGIQALQNRMTELENKVTNLNNTDNALIRAGSVSKATYYSANIFGIKQRTDRG